MACLIAQSHPCRIGTDGGCADSWKNELDQVRRAVKNITEIIFGKPKEEAPPAGTPPDAGGHRVAPAARTPGGGAVQHRHRRRCCNVELRRSLVKVKRLLCCGLASVDKAKTPSLPLLLVVKGVSTTTGATQEN